MRFSFLIPCSSPDFLNRIKAPIIYIPAIVAQPAFLRRQQAYENAALIPGPHSDPEGWLSLPTTILRGALTGNVTKNIAIECSVSLIILIERLRDTDEVFSYISRSLSRTLVAHTFRCTYVSRHRTQALSLFCVLQKRLSFV